MRTRSLRATLFRTVIIPAVAVALILLGVVLLATRLVGEAIIERQALVVRALARQGDRYLAETEPLLHILVDSIVDMSLDHQTELLAHTRVDYSRFDALYLLDETGRVLVESTDAFTLLGLDMSGERFFRPARGSGRTHFSDPFVSLTTGEVSVTAAAPIIEDGQFRGMLVGELNLALLQQAIEESEAGESGTTFVVDRHGTLVAHPRQAWVQERHNMRNLSLVQEGLASGDALEVFYDDSQDTWLVGSATSTSWGWIVVTAQPVTMIARPLIILIAASGLALVLSFALLLRVQVYSLRKITKPVAVLTQRASALSRGRYEDTSAEQMGEFSEIISLESSFARMVEAVRERDRFLEQRVVDRTQRLEIVATLGERLSAILDPVELLTAAVNSVREGFDYYFASIWLVDDDRENLVLTEATGESGAEMKSHGESIHLDAAKSLIARAARTGEVVQVDDVHQTTDWLFHYRLPHTRSEIAVPIIIEEEVIGVLNVQEDRIAAFDASEADMFRSVANQVGVALHTARLYTGLENLVAERTSELILANEALEGELQERRRVKEERAGLVDQIEKQAKRVQQIVDTVPEGVLLLDPAGQAILTNPVGKSALTILANAEVGDTLTRLGDRSLEDLLAPPPRGLWHEVAAGGPSSLVFEVIARPIENGPETTGWVLVLRDVTREREIQQQIHRQERLVAMGQLAAGIAHDFNNIMATIILYAQMVSMVEGLSTRDRERMATINQQALHTTNLIQQILDFSRRAVLERRPLDLVPFLKTSVRLLERTLPESIEIDLAYGSDEYTVNADPTRVQQVVMNLAINARDAMPEGGKLLVGLDRLRIEDRAHAPLPDMEMGEWVRLTVADAGTGIPSNALPHIFEPFFTTKSPGEGTGLGLAQVWGIVQQHEGHISVHSRAGEGTTFTLYLPAFQVARPELLAQGIPALPRGRGETILVVEDNAATREALVESLELLNYRVHTATNGREALTALEQHAGEISLMLSDLVMPEMSGAELFHTLRRRNLLVPVVILTGHPKEDELENLRAQGLSAWLPKPVRLERLAEIVALMLKDT